MGDYNKNEATVGYGKKLEYADTINGVKTKVPGTVNINFPEAELGTSEMTNDDSPDNHKEYIPGMYEPGTLTVSYKYGKTAFALIQALFYLATLAIGRVGGAATSAEKFFTFTLADGSTAAFRGFFTKNGFPAEMEDGIECEAEIQVNGKVTFTPKP